MIIPCRSLCFNRVWQGITHFQQKTDDPKASREGLFVPYVPDRLKGSLPLEARIVGIIDRNQRIGFVYGLQVRFEFAAHGFLVARIYDFRTGGQRIEIPIPQLRRPLGRLLLIGNIRSRIRSNAA